MYLKTCRLHMSILSTDNEIMRRDHFEVLYSVPFIRYGSFYEWKIIHHKYVK